MNKFIKCISIMLFTCIVVLLSAPLSGARVNAAVIETQRKASLSIHLAHDDEPVAGVKYSLYKVADLKENGVFTLIDDFKNADISVDVDENTAEDWRLFATMLKGYVYENGITPIHSKNTDSDGIAYFSQLDCGLYLVLGTTATIDNNLIIPTPFMVCLPGFDADENYQYDVTLNAKYTLMPEDEKVKIEVLKIWDDNSDNEEMRPLNITVALYKGSTLYDTISLSKANNWHYIWTDLPSADWCVYEKNIPDGYSLSVEQQGARFVLTNSLTPPEEPTTTPDETTTNPDETTTTPDETTTTPYETTTAPDETTTTPDETTTIPGETTTNSEKTTDKNDLYEATTSQLENSELPDTGQLWWPVPVLSAIGLLLIMFGFCFRKGDEDE